MIDTDKRLKSILLKLSKRPVPPLGKFVAEAAKLHEQIPKVPRGRFALLPDATLQSQALQSRLVGIQALNLREKLYLEGVRDELDSYLRAKYWNFLDRHNRQTQTALVESALAPILRRIRALDSAHQVMTAYLDDFISNRFSLSSAAKALEASHRGDV